MTVNVAVHLSPRDTVELLVVTPDDGHPPFLCVELDGVGIYCSTPDDAIRVSVAFREAAERLEAVINGAPDEA